MKREKRREEEGRERTEGSVLRAEAEEGLRFFTANAVTFLK